MNVESSSNEKETGKRQEEGDERGRNEELTEK